MKPTELLVCAEMVSINQLNIEIQKDQNLKRLGPDSKGSNCGVDRLATNAWRERPPPYFSQFTARG
jgi:hypothetical protein